MRLAVLHACGVLDTAQEPDFDSLVELASRIARTPIALVSLVDAERQWFKARVGLEATETPRAVAFCAHAIHTPAEPFVVPDARQDPRFCDNPLVTGAPTVIFYAGIPLRIGEGREPVGTLCVIDHVPRELSGEQLGALQLVARQAELLLELRARALELQAARDAAERADRAKSAFLATMSHEIRTPLNGVLGIAEILQGTALDAEQADLVATLRSSGRSLLAILNDVLDWSKIQADGVSVQTEPLPVCGVIREVVDVLRPRSTEPSVCVSMAVEDPAAELWVLADPQRLRQVLTNLVGNALKFTERGCVTLRCSATETAVRVAVEDTGIGIPAQEIPRLFTRFTQVEDGPSRRFGGTGLGLAISQELARAMGGTISVASELGVGSTFTLELVRTLPTRGGASPTPSESAPSPALGRGRSLRLLLAEDNPVNQRVATLLLRGLGHSVTVVGDGTAVLAADPTEFDAILMDLQMPVMDGLEATRQLRLRERATGAAPLPVLALTASALEEERAACLAAGMDGVVTKPVSAASLRAGLDELLRSTGAHAGSEASERGAA